MTDPLRPPRDNLVRAFSYGPELRSDTEDENAMPVIRGEFSVFNQWTEINSMWEGRFMERIAPGAFKKTIAEHRSDMRMLFQHGRDPQIGDKPLAPIEDIGETDSGAFYEGRMLDTAYNRELLPGLKAGLYGSSFRFSVVKEEVVQKPKRSAHNPEGLPERTVKEARLYEMGPVTFPAYSGATAGVRSLTDAYVFGQFTREPERFKELLEGMQALPKNGAEAQPHSAPGSRSKPTPKPTSQPPVRPQATIRKDPAEAGSSVVRENTFKMTIAEIRARQEAIQARLSEIHAEYGADELPEETRSEWDGLAAERDQLAARVTDYEARSAIVAERSEQPAHRMSVGQDIVRGGTRQRVPADIYSVDEYRNLARSMDELGQAYRDGAMKAVERAVFPHDSAKREQVQDHIAKLLDSIDTEDGKLARRLLATGSPAYARAFGKAIAGVPLSFEEQRAMSLTGNAGGFAVPFQLDPTIIPTSNGVVNPLRAISRVETIAVNEWRGVSSAGISAAYATEAAEASDNSPTLAQPTVTANRAQAFIPFSIELDQDYSGLQSELARQLQDAKDELEAAKFLTGTGTNEPQGLLVGATTTVTAAGVASFAVADLYKLEEAVPPRHRPLAHIIGNRAIFNKVRQFDTQGGAALWVRLDAGQPAELIGYPAHEASEMASALTTANKILVMGDFRQYLIVDRVGMSVELVQHIVGTNHRPTGQRGMYAIWRNSAKVLNANGFRVLVTG